jgi:tetratricopeptide (TPR) repeat protein
MVGDAPVLGQGLGAYGYWSPRYLAEALHAPGGEQHMHNNLHAAHAHSEPLEILAETGSVGLLCCLWMLARLTRCRGPEWGALCALLVFGLFNAPFRSAPHALAGLLLASALMARRESCGEAAADSKGADAPVSPVKRSCRAAALVAVFTLGTAAFRAWAELAPSVWLRSAQDAHLEGRPSLRLYERVLRHPWPNAEAHEDYAIALDDAGRTAEAYRQFQRALNGLDTGRIYWALGKLAAELGHENEARVRLQECVFRWPAWKEGWALLLTLSPEVARPALLERAARWLPDNTLHAIGADEIKARQALGEEHS